MSIQIGSVTITNDPEHESDVWQDKKSQVTKEYEDGTFETYSTGRTMYRGLIVLRFVKQSEYRALRDWLVDTVSFSKTPFDIVPPSFFDAGLGDGVTVTGCTYVGNPTTKEVFTPNGRLYRYDIEFPYAFPKPISSGVLDAGGVIAI